ncbi:alpha-glucuronidase family glycosyl hydrolase [Halococcus hamelinensis]|uniref:Alpha-glucuronidase n=1 Tax=Halococcus hamelinensis 100A6 TaxID=1132509 RepID=M0LV14_9EURY|nr:alpha-glucuronidase family glycosyl hydrolase [Halococcus hamelinensis]EMA37306.1 alpha-glucuronidase [Halococcus hamelinensis 100A6]
MSLESYDDCWLRYEPADGERRESYRTRCENVYASVGSPELGAVRDELRRAMTGLLEREPHLWQHPPRSVEGFLAVGTPDEMEMIADSVSTDRVAALGDGGFRIRSVEWEGAECVVVTASTDRGLVYGTFHLLRRMANGHPIDDLDVTEEPANHERVIDHWDDPFRRSVERGYAGPSIFDWERLPDLRERYVDYARLLASVGINGVVLNNVNTKIPGRGSANEFVSGKAGWQLLTQDGLEKVAALASVFRRYGVRPYLSVNYAAPMLIDDYDTADPLDPDVEEWWARKAEEVYDAIPDFGGFLVKADSEGQNGPYDYDRTHAEGANVLARALEPHGGRVWWRAFVYADHDDRAVQAYETFEPLDGEFLDNVTLQVKNGPIDFQPREPVSTLFGAMDGTDLACELQITQEYTGQGVHTCYLVPQWKEVLDFDTHASGEGSPAKDVFSGSEGAGIAGVGVVGEDPTWTGNYLSQANLYGFGRLAWDPDLDTETVTDEWVRQTFGGDPAVIDTVSGILHDSLPATVDYETGGLGLIHMMYNGEARLENHYDPSPAEWPGYHGATEDGIGIDRTSGGSGYVGQYHEPVAETYDDPETCPEELLLFFHHLPWEYELADGTTVVQRLYDNCFSGVEVVRDLRERWQALAGRIDDRRYRHVAERLEEQVVQAERWRDTLVAFFYEHSEIPDEHGRVPLTESNRAVPPRED